MNLLTSGLRCSLVTAYGQSPSPSHKSGRCLLTEIQGGIPSGVKEMPRRRANGGTMACSNHARQNQITGRAVDTILLGGVQSVAVYKSIPTN